MNTAQKLFLAFIIINLVNITHSSAAVRCTIVQYLGNLGSRYIDNQMSDKLIGQKVELTKRKALNVTDVNSVRFRGCTMNFNLGVVLERKIRRNAKGTIGVSGTISSFSRHSICLRNIRVRSVKLSHSTGLGESIYKAVANKLISNNSCFNL